MTDLLPVLVLGPLLVGAVAAVLPTAGARVVTLASGLSWLVLAVLLARAVAAGGPQVVTLGRWERPVAIELRADGLGTVMVLVTAVVALGVAVHAAADPGGTGTQASGRWYWPLWSFLCGSLQAVFLAGDLFNTYVALELLTVTAVAMVVLGGRSSVRAALRYLLVAVLGSLAFLMAVAVAYAGTGTLAVADVDADGMTSTAVLVALALATVGLALKTALWPLHGWLPPAHAGAPGAVSPLMSALVVKASLVVLVRWWTDVADLRVPDAAAQVLALLGAAAIVHGSLAALRQSSIKRVVACSTVAQVGYFLLALPLLMEGGRVGELAWQGLVLLVVAHALAKAAMFLAAASLARAHGTTDLDAMRGAGARAPAEVMTFAVAGVVLAGLPPGLAFAGKWQLLTAGLDAGQWWWVAVLLVGGLLTFGYVGRVLAVLLARTDEESAEDVDVARERPLDRSPARARWAALVLVLLAVGLGLRPLEVADLAVVGVPESVVR